MLSLILSIFLTLVYPANADTVTLNNQSTQVTTLDDTGGESGHIPPPPPPPPPPPRP